MDDIRPPQPESEVLPARAVSLGELYVRAGELPQVQRTEGSWLSSLALVLVALAATVALLEWVLHYQVW